MLQMSEQLVKAHSFWSGKRVIVTGGSGFLGSFVVNKLWKRGVAEVIVPRRKDYDLRNAVVIRQLLRETRSGGKPVDMVIHLAANVGGINRGKPAESFYDNLMMGVQLRREIL